ncbi:HAD family hydrolase (plasmid) [Pseudoalteromonas sp. T1lg65]|uniref:HAD family hydrolase n=1 Tax=Pseudoalteromonas sp. T1lg65 TaxID=2077101 RepID=UPI003F7A3008
MDRNLVTGVIFDLDGTLVTSELNFSLIKAQIGCPKNLDLLSYIENLPSPYMREEAMNIVHQHELYDASHCEALPGVHQVLEALKAARVPTAVVTRNFSKAANLKLKTAKLPISLLLTRDDAPAKPDPTALIHVAQHWRMPTQHCAYVGDYWYDVEAANQADMLSCLYVPNELPDYAAQADVVFSHFDELLGCLSIHSTKPQRYLAL